MRGEVNHSRSPSSTRRQGGAESPRVRVETGYGPRDAPDDRGGPLVEAAEPVDHGPVVRGVAVVVGDVAGSDLPVVADP